jgi:choline dehydrogenase-like flavoprotein
VEFGEIDNGWDVLLPYNANNLNYADLYNITCVPQPGLDGRNYAVLAGAVVGGGSAVNGMFFDRGSADDYNAWELLGNPGWGWAGMYPYFQKVSFIFQRLILCVLMRV